MCNYAHLRPGTAHSARQEPLLTRGAARVDHGAARTAAGPAPQTLLTWSRLISPTRVPGYSAARLRRRMAM